MAAPNPFEKQNAIPGVKHIIAVSSGKGGASVKARLPQI